MSDRITVALHLGVHKTATTYMQSRLYNSREILKENGVSYIPLGEVRHLITSKINRDNFSSQGILDSVKPYMYGKRLLISDENLIGGTNKPKDNKIYPGAKYRVEKLIEAFNEFDVEVFITLRAYAPYFISRYAESLRHFPFQDFGKYYRDIDMDTVSWVDVIEAIKSAGAKKITITDFGDLFGDEQNYLNLLTGVKGLVLESADDNPATRRSKFSQQGYEVARYFARHYSPSEAKKIVRLLDNTPQTKPATPFMPFTEEQQQRLGERYSAELKELGHLNDGVVALTTSKMES